MRRRRRNDPVSRNIDGSYTLVLDDHERELIVSFVGRLRELLVSGDPDPRTRRLYPTAYSADDEADAEWQRLMREELVASRLAAIDRVSGLLAEGSVFGPGDLTGLMITVNAVRLVLGTLLGITDDGPEAGPDADAEEAVIAQWHLYQWFGWLLEWIVDAQETE